MAKSNYQSLSEQLDQVVARLQQPDIQVDEAVKLYEQGLKLVRECEMQLKVAQNKITKLKVQSEHKE